MERKKLKDTEAFVLLKSTKKIYYFECLFHSKWAVLCSVGFDLTKDMDIAQDAAQHAFIEAFKRIDDFTILTGLTSFLILCVRNYCLNHLRLKGRFEFSDSIDSEEQTKDFEEIVFKNEVINQYFQLLNLLPDQERRVMELTWYGYDTEEVSIKMGLARQSVRNTKERAIRHMRQFLSGEREWINAKAFRSKVFVANGKKLHNKKSPIYDFG